MLLFAQYENIVAEKESGGTYRSILLMGILTTETINLIAQRESDDANGADTTFSSIQDITNYLQSFKVQTETVANFSVVDANIRLRILIDLTNHYKVPEPKDNSNKSIIDKIKLACLALIGTAYHICNGFAGGASILSLFLGVPAWATLAVGIFLSLVYLILFLYIDLATISENLKVKFFKSRKLIDIYLEQEAYLKLLIQNIKQKVQDRNNEQVSLALDNQHNPQAIKETQEFEILLEALILEKENLAHVANTYQNELEKCYVRTLKLIFPLFTDALFFSYGFFTGEAMIQIISAAFNTSLAIASGPGVALCIFAGLAALSLYWLNDRLSVENLIGVWVGLDLQKIQLLPTQDRIQADKEELTSLQNITKLLNHPKLNTGSQQESTELSTGPHPAASTL